MINRFILNEVSYFGAGSRKELPEEIKSLGIKLKYILLTHGHFDHIMGVDVFKEQFGVDAYVSQEDIEQVKITPNMIFTFTGLHALTKSTAK